MFDLIRARIGATVTRVRRLRYEFQGTADSPGDLELWFGDEVLRFKVAPNAEDLNVEDRAWVDPFAPPLSVENAAFVVESGKFVAVDVTHEPMYLRLANRILTEAIAIPVPGGNIVGARLHIGDAWLRLIVEGDEIVVAFEAP